MANIRQKYNVFFKGLNICEDLVDKTGLVNLQTKKGE